MNNISKRQLTIIYFFLASSFLTFFGSDFFAIRSGKYGILVIILGSIISLFFVNFYIWMMKQKKRENFIFKIIEMALLSVILLFSINQMCKFIGNNLILGVNFYIVLGSFLSLVLYLNFKGIKVMMKSMELYFYFFMLLFILMIVGIVNYIDIENLRMNLSNVNSINILRDVTVFIILIVSPTYFIFELNENNSSNIGIKKGLIFANLYILIIMILTIGSLGLKLTIIYDYPEIVMLKKISFFNIFNRVENLFAINFFASGLIYISICFYMLVSKTKDLFRAKKRTTITLIIALLLFILVNNNVIQPEQILFFLAGIMIIPILKTR